MKKLLLTLMLALVSTSAMAKGHLNLEDVYVYSEDDTEQMKQCDLNNADAIAAVESSLRYNRISVKGDFDSSKAAFYINITAAKIREDYCAASVRLRVSTYGNAVNTRLTNERFYSEILLCEQSFLLADLKMNIQTKVNDGLRSDTEKCISTVLKEETK